MAAEDMVPSLESKTSDGSASSSDFFITIQSSTTTDLIDTASNTESIDVVGSINPETVHVGKTADIFIVDSRHGGFAMKTADGNFVPWSGSFEDLEPAVADTVLSEDVSLDIYSGPVDYVGDHNLYLGYRLEGESRLIHSSIPVSLTVVPADAAVQLTGTASALTSAEPAPEESASALTSAVITRSDWRLQYSSRVLSTHPSETACVEAVKLLATSTAKSYSCQTTTQAVVGTASVAGQALTSAPVDSTAQLSAATAVNATVTRHGWSLYYETQLLSSNRSEEVCIDSAELRGATTPGNYYCKTFTKVVVSTSSTSEPVDCVVSAWSAWVPGPAGYETRTRTVITAAANGGTACPALTETRSLTAPTFTASPTTLTTGQSTTLSWSGTAPCTASASPSVTGWSGSVTAASSKTVAPTATATLTLTCANGAVSRTVTVNPASGSNVVALPTPLSRTLAPISSSALDVAVLNFSHTANREWDYGGHNVPDTFSTSYGYWDYSDTYIAAWLFDRATTWYRLYALTNNSQHRNNAIRDTAYYASKINDSGYYIPKAIRGENDTKYGYVTPFLLYERMTGDTKYRPVAQRVYQASVKGYSSSYPISGFWTEREAGIHGEAALSYYEITKDQAALNRAGAIIRQVGNLAAANGGAPQVPYHQHEGGGASSLTNSPWMSALYYQFARRYYEVTGDTSVLQQVSAYFDWLDVNGFYDGSQISSSLAGVTVPRYLTGPLVGDAVYKEGDIMHCLDVAGIVSFAVDAKRKLGLSTTKAQQRLDQLESCAVRTFSNWTRSTSTLPKYRISPDRAWNWWMRGRYELLP